MSDTHRILIVEDSPTQALSLAAELQSQGWEAMHAATAEEAIAIMEHDPPHLIVIDYYLPGMRGDELCRRLRMNINTRSIPIIMLTSDDHEGVEVRGLESGADSFVSKAADREILMLRIRVMLGRGDIGESVLEQSPSFFKRARILAIDDSETYLCHLETLLTQEGYEIECASDASDGLERMKTTEFDCVLVDLVMPELDGIAVCKQIVTMRERLDNPIAVLMLTGREGKDDLTRALEAGADDFVGKSSDVAVLKGRIRALLRRKFFQEENQRILEELKNKELETARERAEKEAAEAREAKANQMHAEAVAMHLTEAKEKLQHTNDELMKTNDELRRFAYVASHDLQEPLRSITSFCDLLKECYAGKLDEQADDFIERITGGAKRMKALVHDLLSYSRIAQEQEVAFTKVQLEDVVYEVQQNLLTAQEEAKATIEFEELPAVMADRSQLVQLMQNLIGNALKYRSDQAPHIVVSAADEGEYWRCSVKDNGIGISEEHLEYVFELFKRLHGRGKYPGTGIGLAVCKRIVEKHRGRIWVESRAGEGSEFMFTLTKAHEEKAHEHSECPAAAV